MPTNTRTATEYAEGLRNSTSAASVPEETPETQQQLDRMLAAFVEETAHHALTALELQMEERPLMSVECAWHQMLPAETTALRWATSPGNV